MREILFRGKTLENDRWIDGDLRHWPSGAVGIHDEATKRTIKVDPETVGQYTGLKDKDGKPIFEGDIVFIPGVGYGVIGYDRACFTLGLVECGLCVSEQSEREILGNIHDNPELMEVRNG